MHVLPLNVPFKQVTLALVKLFKCFQNGLEHRISNPVSVRSKVIMENLVGYLSELGDDIHREKTFAEGCNLRAVLEYLDHFPDVFDARFIPMVDIALEEAEKFCCISVFILDDRVAGVPFLALCHLIKCLD